VCSIHTVAHLLNMTCSKTDKPHLSLNKYKIMRNKTETEADDRRNPNKISP